MSSDLFDAVFSSNWNEARRILHSSSNSMDDARRHVEFVRDDYDGKNALHCAFIRIMTPLDVIRSLLVISSSTVAPMKQDVDGYTPLHLSIWMRSDDITMMTIEACPRATLTVDKRGMTPLHYAICWNKSPSVIQQLLIANSKAIKTPDNNGNYPLQRFFEKWNTGLRAALEETFSRKINKSIDVNNIKVKPESSENLYHHVDEIGYYLYIMQNFNSDGIHSNFRKLHEIYNINYLLFQAEKYEEIQTSEPMTQQITPFDVLKMCLINDSCPSSFFITGSLIYPHAATQHDENGNYLLHTAAETRSSFDGSLYKCMGCESQFNAQPWYHPRDDFSLKFCGICYPIAAHTADGSSVDSMQGQENFKKMESLNKSSTAIINLVTLNPMAACIPNNYGTLPLHRAIECGKSFTKGGVQAILDAAPQALVTRDIATHLYPFMVAAVNDVEDVALDLYPYGVSNVENDYLQFTSCFSLLIESVQLISSHCSLR